MSLRCKIIFIGDTGVGKTSITDKLIKNSFYEDTCATIGATFNSKKYNDIGVKCEIWDTAGQEQYDSLSKMYYRDANIVILVIDGARLSSIKRIKPLIKNLHQVVKEDMYELILIINKIDLITEESHAKIMEMIKKHTNHGKIIMTSAKTGRNIDTLEMLIKETSKELGNENKLEENDYFELETDKKKRKKCSCSIM